MPSFEKGLKGSKISIDDLMNLFGGPNATVVGSEKYDGQILSGNLFLPLDYDRGIHSLAMAIQGPKGQIEH